MLYDPKWEQKTETKADPFKLETLIAWLEKQPAAGEYEYTSSTGCALCQYFRAQGINVRTLDICGFSVVGSYTEHSYPRAFAEATRSLPWTYGAALERARAALS
jgi:hypothetical protein